MSGLSKIEELAKQFIEIAIEKNASVDDVKAAADMAVRISNKSYVCKSSIEKFDFPSCHILNEKRLPPIITAD